MDNATTPTDEQVERVTRAIWPEIGTDYTYDEAVARANGLPDDDATQAHHQGAIEYAKALARAALSAMQPSPAEAIPRNIINALGELPDGEWVTQTGCSFRRIGKAYGGADGEVLHALNQQSDGHPDLSWTERQCDAICDIINTLRAIAGEDGQ
ncbi:hypothetical protein [Pseudosulfitobacter pseudonitzschiae]|uniref:hypothetical protein n=1 Tax=Pseudosulfitobacter pseudonitzschiae TaxID=1402135 RepID=UPI001AF1BDC9|nr:hypothetical protein [Pseudosulfitobacter pseudonitzschiae]MBM1817196.1 hypothetical protein [Pseudosulfitobacter pseudonitzschiae]MBM1834207.1 hypothetical protein [Pseudosulfitobacter pseudonitzschiae]MBM1839072.1 hypothetical protein [Pseudosulfitobacter pseudonitzschiae]MBM1843920.1 hypothetical protein [Pseudosulfitobacter pseudonitzschiae]MBM1848757.1 hypothetical protein [Pseudosulfitobacter pseudonitzschiae]